MVGRLAFVLVFSVCWLAAEYVGRAEQQPRLRVSLRDVAGEFLASSEVREGQPVYLNAVSAPMRFLPRLDVRDPALRIVSGVGFVSWRERAGARVWAFYLIPKAGFKNAFYARTPSDVQNLRREPLAEFVLDVGQSRVLREMTAWSIEPYALDLSVIQSPAGASAPGPGSPR
jgi:hypothetical protein